MLIFNLKDVQIKVCIKYLDFVQFCLSTQIFLKRMKEHLIGIISFLKKIAVGIPVAVTFFDVVGYVARVDGVSMQPALNPQKDIYDYIFLSRWALRNRNIERGDIVCVISPKDHKQNIIKRVVGLQGDIITTMGYEKTIVRIPEGHCWVEGDHIGRSFDSNNFGPVSLGLVTAKASFIVWPPSRWQVIHPYLCNSRAPLNIVS